MDVRCPKHHNDMVQLGDGFFSYAWYCKECKAPYQLKLVKMRRWNREAVDKQIKQYDRHRSKLLDHRPLVYDVVGYNDSCLRMTYRAPINDLTDGHDFDNRKRCDACGKDGAQVRYNPPGIYCEECVVDFLYSQNYVPKDSTPFSVLHRMALSQSRLHL